jgi:hypothetical protein
MSKKEISWIGLIKVLIAEKKKAGEPAGVKDVMDVAKKEWVEIKAGKHAKYIKGKQVITRRKKSKSKSKSKTAKKRCDDEEDPATEMAAIVDQCKLCKKCMKEIKKHIK